jgi:hypothetical protein
MKKLTYENISEELIKTIPELKQAYITELEWWGEEKPGNHIIYGNILNPYIISLLKSSGNEEILKRIFSFLEELTYAEDELVHEVVAVTVCERLIDDPEILLRAREFMGDSTRNISKEIELAFRGEDSEE